MPWSCFASRNFSLFTGWPQPESVPSDELDRWLEGEIREARRQAEDAVRLFRTDQKWSNAAVCTPYCRCAATAGGDGGIRRPCCRLRTLNSCPRRR
jgi:hypothetical protein